MLISTGSRPIPDLTHTNSSNWSPYFSIKNYLRELVYSLINLLILMFLAECGKLTKSIWWKRKKEINTKTRTRQTKRKTKSSWAGFNCVNPFYFAVALYVMGKLSLSYRIVLLEFSTILAGHILLFFLFFLLFLSRFCGDRLFLIRDR